MSDPIIFAHRGLTSVAPENTLAAFGAAFAQGFGIETDLHMSADGEIVLIHDRTVDRTTSGSGTVGSGTVAEMTVAQLQALDAGSWYDARFAAEQIPTLVQLLDQVVSHPEPVLLGLEIKALGPSMLEQLCEAIDARSLFEQVLGFGRDFGDADFRRRLKAVDPRFPTSTRAERSEDSPAALVDADADWLYTRFVPSRAQVAQAHDAGKRVLASAAPVMEHHPHNWLAAREAGVAVLLTDYAEECRAVYGG